MRAQDAPRVHVNLIDGPGVGVPPSSSNWPCRRRSGRSLLPHRSRSWGASLAIPPGRIRLPLGPRASPVNPRLPAALAGQERPRLSAFELPAARAKTLASGAGCILARCFVFIIARLATRTDAELPDGRHELGGVLAQRALERLGRFLLGLPFQAAHVEWLRAARGGVKSRGVCQEDLALANGAAGRLSGAERRPAKPRRRRYQRSIQP